MSLETPKKKVAQNKRGRKRKGEEAFQYCKICHRPFAVTYGNFEGAKRGYISTENIFQVPQKKGLTKPVAGFLENNGFHLESGEEYSTRVCSPALTRCFEVE